MVVAIIFLILGILLGRAVHNVNKYDVYIHCVILAKVLVRFTQTFILKYVEPLSKGTDDNILFEVAAKLESVYYELSKIEATKGVPHD